MCVIWLLIVRDMNYKILYIVGVFLGLVDILDPSQSRLYE
jgi:hypothetical protein